MITNEPSDDNKYDQDRNYSSLVDRGANGSIAGNDLRLITHEYPERTITIQGIDNHTVPDLRIGTYGAAARTQYGNVILIFNQYAQDGHGNSIHSALQLEDNDIKVDDRPLTLGGTQSLVTAEGYTIPLNFNNGLAHMNLRPFTNDEWITLPHVTMTRNLAWTPHQYDSSN